MDIEEFPLLYADPHAQELAWQMTQEQPELGPIVESMARHSGVISQPQLAIYSLMRIQEIYRK